MSRDQKSREFKLRRTAGMSPEAVDAMHKANEQTVWRGTCRICGAQLEGTPDELRAHKH